jgi:hypothetical protein
VWTEYGTVYVIKHVVHVIINVLEIFDVKESVLSAYTVYLCVSYDSHNKQRLFP